ncbi:transposase [Halosquirtibacter laminarini]|uniref:transposase n=1 Tax=Halosquirtibacter laminarini TaxID=3374600 RepID=UPI003747D773
MAFIVGNRKSILINKLPLNKRQEVKEVTLDMAGAMGKVVQSCFPKASKVIDRFHVKKLAYDALQEIRINIVGMPSKKIMRLNVSKKKVENIHQNYFLMEILLNNFLQEVVTCYSSLKTNGEKKLNSKS